MVSFLTIVWKTRHTNFKLKHMYLAEEVVFTEVNLLSGLPRHWQVKKKTRDCCGKLPPCRGNPSYAPHLKNVPKLEKKHLECTNNLWWWSTLWFKSGKRRSGSATTSGGTPRSTRPTSSCTRLSRGCLLSPGIYCPIIMILEYYIIKKINITVCHKFQIKPERQIFDHVILPTSLCYDNLFCRKTLVLVGPAGVGRRSLLNKIVSSDPNLFGTTKAGRF